MSVEKLPQWDIEVSKLPEQGDKVSVCGVDFTFGTWDPAQNYDTSYNVKIGGTVEACASNLVAAINGWDSKYGGSHLNRYISQVYAMQFGKVAHVRMRDTRKAGDNVTVSANAGDRLTVTVYEGNIDEGGGGGGGGGSATLIEKSITENGTYRASSDNADGYSKVTVSVAIPEDPVLVEKSVTENGTYNASSDSADGFSKVVVAVPGPTLTEKAVSENGTYNASDDSADGFSKVTVTVPEPTLVEKTVSVNGTYTASGDNADGYSKVTVSVPSPTLVEKSVTENGTYLASGDSADGYSKVSVSVPEPVLTEKSVTENGTYNASSDSSDGYSKVVVAVPEPVITTKSVTANGTYSAANDNADGYSSVSVAVPGPTLVEKSVNTNGTYTATSDSADGYSKVTVAVPSPTLVEKSVNSNGTYTASGDNADGYSKVTVAVPAPTLVEKSVASNGVYTASSDSADGYSKVTVAIPDPVLVKDKIVRTNSEIVASNDSANGFANVIIRAKSARLVPYRFDFGTGYVNVSGSQTQQGFIREDNASLKNDIYKVKANRRYTIYFDSAHGSRGRVMFTSANPLVVSGNITRDIEEYNVSTIGDASSNWGNAFNNIPTVDGYYIVQKSNTNQSGLQSYVLDKDFYSNPIADENPVLIIKPTTSTLTAGAVSVTDGALDTSIAISVLDESGTETADVTAPVSGNTDYSTYSRTYLRDTYLAAVLYAEGSSSPVSTGVVSAGTYTVKLVALGVSDLSKIAPNIILRDGTIVVE